MKSAKKPIKTSYPASKNRPPASAMILTTERLAQILEKRAIARKAGEHAKDDQLPEFVEWR